MPNYIIQKSIEAKDMTEALKNETKGRIIEVWKEKEDKSQLISSIGYQVSDYEE